VSCTRNISTPTDKFARRRAIAAAIALITTGYLATYAAIAAAFALGLHA
jgi:hypothetical protein